MPKSLLRLNIDLSKNVNDSGINKAENYIYWYYHNFDKMRADFVKEILTMIQENANLKLDESSNGFHTSHIRNSWQVVKVSKNQYILRNEDNELVLGGNAEHRTTNLVGISVLAEFGTGVVGGDNPHPASYENNYEYDVNGHEEQGWSFYNPTFNLRLKFFQGYQGHRFLYNAMMDFVNGIYPSLNDCLKIWNRIKNKYISNQG